jgi:cytidylate kinase
MAIVTISREGGSGGEDIAKAAAKRLQYEFVSKESIHKEIEEHGKKWLSWAAIEQLDEHAPTIWERYDRAYAAYLALVAHCVYKNALKNNVVILGRGGNYLLESVPYALRVRITASAEYRVGTFRDRFGIDEEGARKMLMHSDHERSIFLKRAYHKEWANPDDYDMTLNSGHMGFDELITLIVDEIPARDRLFTPEAEEILRRLELAARVKADIITRFSMFIPTLEVHHDGSAIVLRGVCLFTKEKMHELMETAIRSAGSTRVRSELHPRGA